ncbi:MAG: hypothetical protein NC299_18350 [Lachnospiraceae bacterium]|nr:hypothetical protein [Ruminococcus sp.]MCM1277290.1 hypothetical protein [Lachnospiraceae bacterium]
MDFYNTVNNEYLQLAKENIKTVITKIEILAEDETVIGEIGDDVIQGTDSYDCEYAQGLQAKLSFSVPNISKIYTGGESSWFWYTRKIKYWKGLSSPSNGNSYWFSRGIFIVTGITVDFETVNVSCVDKFGILTSDYGSTMLDKSLKIEIESTVGNFASRLLALPKGNGQPIDCKKPLIDYDVRDISTGEELEMAEGTYAGDILLEFANTLKCRVYYDRDGVLRICDGGLDYAYENKSTAWSFYDGAIASVISASLTYDFPNAKNVITVWGEDFEGLQYTSTAENRNAKSALSIEKVGYRTAQTKENLFGYSQENVDAFAKMRLQMLTIIGTSVTVECPMLPHIEVEQCVEIDYEALGLLCKRFLVSGVSYSGSSMSISLVNLDNLPWHLEMQ